LQVKMLPGVLTWIRAKPSVTGGRSHLLRGHANAGKMTVYRLPCRGQISSAEVVRSGRAVRAPLATNIGRVRPLRLCVRLGSILNDRPPIRQRQACVYRQREFENRSPRGPCRTGVSTTSRQRTERERVAGVFARFPAVRATLWWTPRRAVEPNFAIMHPQIPRQLTDIDRPRQLVLPASWPITLATQFRNPKYCLPGQDDFRTTLSETVCRVSRASASRRILPSLYDPRTL
jgi:hypothetical protein